MPSSVKTHCNVYISTPLPVHSDVPPSRVFAPCGITKAEDLSRAIDLSLTYTRRPWVIPNAWPSKIKGKSRELHKRVSAGARFFRVLSARRLKYPPKGCFGHPPYSARGDYGKTSAGSCLEFRRMSTKWTESEGTRRKANSGVKRERANEPDSCTTHSCLPLCEWLRDSVVYPV